MADEETTPQEPEVAEDASVSAPQAASETDGEVAASESTGAETDASPEAPADEEPDVPAADAPAQAAPAASGGGTQEVLKPKERRQRVRAAKAAARKPRSQMSPEERQAERDSERRRKAAARRSRRATERQRARAGATAAPEALPSLRPERTGQQKTRQGIVVSDRAAKTITVRIDVTRRHPQYSKVVRTSTTLHAHDERDEAHIGDTVVIRESRPLSRTKRWRLMEVLERAK